MMITAPRRLTTVMGQPPPLNSGMIPMSPTHLNHLRQINHRRHALSARPTHTARHLMPLRTHPRPQHGPLRLTPTQILQTAISRVPRLEPCAPPIGPWRHESRQHKDMYQMRLIADLDASQTVPTNPLLQNFTWRTDLRIDSNLITRNAANRKPFFMRIHFSPTI